MLDKQVVDRMQIEPSNFWGHLKTVCTHKYLVMQGCFRVGLYRQGLTHDLSKFSPTEFGAGIRYFQGHRSPNAAEREAHGYSASWLHHKGRNKHHYEYWIDYSVKEGVFFEPIQMPRKYVTEMLMDRIAASKVYLGDAYTDRAPLEYYLSGAKLAKEGKVQPMHPETEKQLYKLLTMLAGKGEDFTFSYIRRRFLKGK